MKISTKGRYGLRALLDLYLHLEEAPVSLAEIAKRQGLSYSYLETIFAALKKIGLVSGEAGVSGGYRALRPAAEVTAGEVLTALEGNLSVTDRSQETLSPLRQLLNQEVWDPVDRDVQDLLESTTLQDLLDRTV